MGQMVHAETTSHIIGASELHTRLTAVKDQGWLDQIFGRERSYPPNRRNPRLSDSYDPCSIRAHLWLNLAQCLSPFLSTTFPSSIVSARSAAGSCSRIFTAGG